MLKAEPRSTLLNVASRSRKGCTAVIPAHPDMNISYEVLGDRLARLRRNRGLSKTDLAGRLRVTVTSICYWAQGRTPPRPAPLPALADLLGTSPTHTLSRASAPGGDHPPATLGPLTRQIPD